MMDISHTAGHPTGTPRFIGATNSPFCDAAALHLLLLLLLSLASDSRWYFE